jgi:hypothetical protein
MSWSNAALPSEPDTEFHFPAGKVLSHASRITTIDWTSQGPRRESDIKEMTGYFWATRDANAFGVFTPSRASGLYHVAEQTVAPGMKLWSYGTGEDREWALLSTATRQPYIEMQGGPIADQSTKLELHPRETRTHTEYWIPTAKALDIYSLKVPHPELRPLEAIPLFEWARRADVEPWTTLAEAYNTKGKAPNPPSLENGPWAPSGMEDLGPAFQWVIDGTTGDVREHWRCHYGTWLAGTGEIDKAIGVLSTCDSGVGKALLARLLASKRDFEGAARAFAAIHETSLQLHPQIVVERDKVLRHLGKATLAERAAWLKRVDALPDEWLAERRVQLLIDQGQVRAARQLLLGTRFQHVHQTYSRTGLWMQICTALGEPCHPVPRTLGEDRLARFGAYREYE